MPDNGSWYSPSRWAVMTIFYYNMFYSTIAQCRWKKLSKICINITVCWRILFMDIYSCGNSSIITSVVKADYHRVCNWHWSPIQNIISTQCEIYLRIGLLCVMRSHHHKAWWWSILPAKQEFSWATRVCCWILQSSGPSKCWDILKKLHNKSIPQNLSLSLYSKYSIDTPALIMDLN